MVEVDNIIAFPACETLAVLARPAPMLTGLDVDRIETLRHCLQRSLLLARCDVDRACATIAFDRTGTINALSYALFGLLSEYAVRNIAFHPPGSSEFTDAEIWLARVLRAVQHGDQSQARALVGWRVSGTGQRRAMFLIEGLVTAFTEPQAPRYRR